jgi:hypothetical protein
MTTATRRWAIDAALAALVTGVQLAVALAPLRWNGHAESQPGSFGIILLIIAGAALVARRRFPGAVLGVVLAATLGAEALGAHGVWLALIVAFCTAVLRGRRWPAIASLVIGSPPMRGGVLGGVVPPGANSGLAWMGERAGALGGTLTAGPRPEGGFRVLARLPT